MQTRYQTHNGFKTVYLYDYGFKKQPIITNHASKNNPRSCSHAFQKTVVNFAVKQNLEQ